MKKIRVMVFMGGKSDEHEVSLASGKQVIANLDPKKFEITPIIIDKNTDQNLPQLLNLEEKPDVVFLALHGKYGEDGRIQGMLDMLGLPYTGCGCLASAIGMDKIIFKKIIEQENIPTAKWQVYKKGIKIKTPCVVKPSNNGSSVGVSIVKNRKDLDKAIRLARKSGSSILVEEYIKGTEISCAVIGNKKPTALPVIEIVPKKEFFDYEAKYTDGKSEEICPAKLSKEITKKIQETAIKVFQSIQCRGYARIDMIIKNNIPYVLEINTLPGLTPNSLLPKEAKAAGISYPKLLEKIIDLALSASNYKTNF